MLRLYFSLGLTLLVWQLASSQSLSLPPGLQLSLDIYQGNTLRHRPTMVFDLPQPSRMISFELSRQTEGSKPWHKLYGYPRIGWTISMLAYGNREVLGRAYSLHPYLDIFFLRKKRWLLFSRISYGLAYVDRQHDRLTNVENNAIGSGINNHASLNLITEARLTPRLWIRAGGTFSHNSNGKLQVPNLGLNTPKLRLGATYEWTPAAERISVKEARSDNRFVDRLQLHLRYGMAFTEDKVPQGPKYPIRIGSAHLTYQFGRKNRLQLGWEFLNNRSVREFLLNHQVEVSIPSLRYNRHALLIGHEFLLARLGLMTQAFVYMNPPFQAGDPNPWGVKIGPNYYFIPHKDNRNYNFFAGIYLKAHKAIADYVELAVGINFGPQKK
ncbi:MAG: acyloxyacyl hydrolase [Bacteroidota bacterium]